MTKEKPANFAHPYKVIVQVIERKLNRWFLSQDNPIKGAINHKLRVQLNPIVKDNYSKDYYTSV